MDVVGSAASLLQLAHFVVSICIEVRATYKSTAGFDASFDSAVLGAEIQVQRLLNWSEAVDIGTCSPTLVDLLGRVLEGVNNEVKIIEGYVEKYMPGKVEMLTRKSSSDHVSDVDSLSPQVHELVRVGKSNSTFGSSKGPSMIKRFHYIISHKDSLLAHATQLEKSVDQLYALAPLEGQVRLELKLLATLIKCDDIDDLRALASSTGSRAYHNIQSSATIKAARLQGQRLRWAANVNSQALKCDRLALKRERIWEGKDIGMYEGRRVLIEWKMCSGELSFEESTNRIVDIARLLYESSHSRPNDLITLDCLGYMQDNRTSPSIGLVYVLPTMPFQEAPKSLHQLLLEKESDGTSWPALERRRTLAYLMARVVFQLHVVGWLHKGIRPQNVVFVDNAKNLKSPYLIGFDYARRGEESEKTEQTDLAFDLYRHPHAQGEARSRFQASFDLFALGLILLEIGLWQSLQDRREDYERKLKVSTRIAQQTMHSQLLEGRGALEDLPFHMGTRYRDAVRTCFTTDAAELTTDVYITDIIGNLGFLE